MSNQAQLTEWEQSVLDRGMKLPKKEFDPVHDSEALEGYIKEALLVKNAIALENEKLKDIKDSAKEALGIKPKLFNQLLNMRFKLNRDEVETESEELLEMYDKVFPKN